LEKPLSKKKTAQGRQKIGAEKTPVALAAQNRAQTIGNFILEQSRKFGYDVQNPGKSDTIRDFEGTR